MEEVGPIRGLAWRGVWGCLQQKVRAERCRASAGGERWIFLCLGGKLNLPRAFYPVLFVRFALVCSDLVFLSDDTHKAFELYHSRATALDRYNAFYAMPGMAFGLRQASDNALSAIT